MSNASHSRKARAKAKEDGLCTRCRKREAAPERTMCHPCREAVSAWVRASRAAKA